MFQSSLVVSRPLQRQHRPPNREVVSSLQAKNKTWPPLHRHPEALSFITFSLWNHFQNTWSLSWSSAEERSRYHTLSQCFPTWGSRPPKGQKIGVRRWLLWQFGDCVNVSLIWASSTLSLSWFLLDIRFYASGRGTLYFQWESGQETLHCNEREIGRFVGTQNERIKFVSQSDADSSKHKTLSVADGDGWPSC